MVIVLIPTRDGLPQQVVATPGSEVLQRLVESGDRKSNALEPSDRDGLMPPLWTWFIENPRSCRA